MPAEDTSATSSAIWVPVCCERVMRHNVFRSGDNVVATAFVCGTCGKSVTLTPATTDSVEEYGAGAQVLRVLGVARPVRRPEAAASGVDPDAETMA